MRSTRSVLLLIAAVSPILLLKNDIVRWGGKVNAQAALARDQPSQSVPDDSKRLAWKMLSDFLESFPSDPQGQELDSPTFKSWKSKCYLFHSCAEAPTSTSKGPRGGAHQFSARAFSFSSQLPLVGGDSTFFNAGASDALSACVKNWTPECSSGKNFKAGAMIARFAWLSVSSGQCSALSVFQFSDTPTYMPSGKIVLDTGSCKDSRMSNQYTLDDFFYVSMTSGSAVTAFRKPEGPLLKSGEKALILGFHLMEKQPSGQWAWATFWWRSDHVSDPSTSGMQGYACAGSECQPKVQEWQHYVMNTVVPPSMGSTQSFAAMSNPYEDPPSQLSTNCLVCHSFATTSPNKNAGQPGAKACGAQPASSVTQETLTSATVAYARNCNRHSTFQIWSAALNPAQTPCGVPSDCSMAPASSH